MKLQAYQYFERRDENDQIIRAGSFGKKTPLANAENTGIIDYFANNIDVLQAAVDGVATANNAVIVMEGSIDSSTVLAKNQISIEINGSNELLIKVGDGTTSFGNLPYILQTSALEQIVADAETAKTEAQAAQTAAEEARDIAVGAATTATGAPLSIVDGAVCVTFEKEE